ncbi:hypothetical protein D3C74_192950 [compost metagenome]|jgi:hypothetical protein
MLISYKIVFKNASDNFINFKKLRFLYRNHSDSNFYIEKVAYPVKEQTTFCFRIQY